VVEIGVMTCRMICPAPEGPMTGSARYEADRDAGSGRLEPCFRSDELEGKLIIEMKTKRIGDC
jgi:coenzyme F420-reducing hydrogenase gamma subunit